MAGEVSLVPQVAQGYHLRESLLAFPVASDDFFAKEWSKAS